MNISKMHDYADRLAASNVGYDQGDRWSFNPARDGRSVTPNSECDCSSSSAAIARAGGSPVDTRDPIFTGNFKLKLQAAGFEAISVRGSGLTSILSKLRAGDFLLGPGHVIYAREKNRWWSAENDERRRSSGGLAGDQTGMEARYRGPYARSKGWEWILRPVFEADPLVATPPLEQPKPQPPAVLPVQPRAVEWRNPPRDLVQIVQEISGVKVDGLRGPRTISAVKVLQRRLGLAQDGHFGPGTAEAFLLAQPNLYRGQDRPCDPGTIRLLQWIVRSRVDGSFGPLTETDVKSAQAWAGLTPDGNVGDTTKKKITF